MRYAKYKPTGIAWLPEVPEGWEMILNQFLFKENIRVPSVQDVPLSLSQADGLLPTDDMKEKPLKTSTYDGWKKVLVGDLVLNRFKAHLGVFFASKYEGMVSFHYGVYVKRRDLLPRYYEYLYHTPQYKFVYSWVSKGMTVGLQNLSNTDFYKVRSPYPPLPTQRAIVAYLDEKCEKVDRLVAAKEKEVALLKELKQSMIAEAVCGKVKVKGEGEQRKMKPSGIQWLPEVPEGWEMKRAKYLFQKEQRPVRAGDEIVTCFRDGEVTLRKNRRISGFTEATDYSHYQHICAGDLVIHQMDAFAGSCGVSDSDGMGTPVLSVCTPKNDRLDVRYFAAVVRLMGLNGFIQSLYRGIRERSSDFRFETFAKQVLPVPSLAEQREIVAHIEARAVKIDAAVKGLEREVAALKEYKQRLIADVVTGQRKVA